MRTFSYFALLIFLSLTFALPDAMAQVSTDRFAKTPMQIPPRLRPAAQVTFSGHLHEKMTLVLRDRLHQFFRRREPVEAGESLPGLDTADL